MEIKTIYLIGFMGSGKSTVGKRLAYLHDLSHVDLDVYFEEKYKQPIPQFFQEYGEELFRTYESAVLKEVSTYDIVSTGGGIVEKEENILTMDKSGVVLYLQASLEEITKRLKNDQTRPLWATSKQDREQLYHRRAAMYEKCAHYIVNTNNKSINEIVNDIKKQIDL